MLSYLLVGVGGALGSMARFGVTVLATRWATGFPLGTLLVNVVGCLLIGVLGHLVIDRAAVGHAGRLLLVTGFLGGLTTFSAFGFDTFELARNGQWGLAAVNVLANVMLSLGAVWAGFAGARVVVH